MKKLQYPLLLCLAFTMSVEVPLFFTNAKFNNILMVLVALNTLGINVLSRKRPAFTVHWMSLLIILIYVADVAGLVKTDDFGQAVSDLTEKKISLFILPLAFFFMPRPTSREVRNILLAFVAGCITTMIICLSVATYRYMSSGTTIYFTYHELSMILQMHAVYLAMYCCFAIAILLHFLPKERSARIMYLCLIAFLAFSIFLLAGRTHIALLVGGGTVGLIKFFRKKDRVVVAIAKAAALGVIISGIAFLFPTNRLRFKQAINYNNEFGMDRQWGEQQMRPLMWHCAAQLIAQYPITGWGTGDGQDELHQCYIKNDFTSLTYLVDEGVRFNAHNQYLETTISIGLLGLLVFLTVLGASFVHAWKEDKSLFLIFLFLFALSCLTESILERRAGCIFYAFFNSLLYFYNVSPRAPQTETA